MAQQEGPFSEYLQQAKLAPPMEVPKPTGLEGTGAAIGNIAMNFLQGLRQGRAQKYMQKEAEEARKEQLLLSAMESIQRSDMLPEAKAQYEAKIRNEFAKRVAGVKEGSKDTGNPLTDFFKRAGMAVLGGEPPRGKKADLDMNIALDAFAAASNPQLSATQAAEGLNREASTIVKQIEDQAKKAGRPLTSIDILNDPRIVEIRNRGTRLGKPTIVDAYLRELGAGGAQTAEMERKRQARQEAMAGITEIPEGQKFSEDYYSQQAQYAKDLGLAVKRDKPKRYVDPETGKLFTGFYVQLPKFTGVINAETGMPAAAASEATALELAKSSPQALAQATTSAKQSIESLFGKDSDSAKYFTSMLGNIDQVKDVNKVLKDAISERTRSIANKYRADQNQISLGQEVRKQLEQSPANKSLSQVDAFYNTVKSYHGRASGLTPAERSIYHKALIGAVAKITDPNSVIRESELKFWGGSARALEQFDKYISSIRDGYTLELSPQEEQALFNLASSIHSNIKGAADRERVEYSNILKQTGVPSNLADVFTGLSTSVPPTEGAARVRTRSVSPAAPDSTETPPPPPTSGRRRNPTAR